MRGVELGGLEVDVRNDTMSLAMPDMSDPDKGTRIPAETVILAVDPVTARELAPDLDWPATTAVTASCLDVALSKLPQPRNLFALGIDTPLYYSVHSRWAQLTPKGGALLHAAKYGEGTEAELEALVDEMQPGWRDLVVHRRFLPAMTVSNALVQPDGKAHAHARRDHSCRPLRRRRLGRRRRHPLRRRLRQRTRRRESDFGGGVSTR